MQQRHILVIMVFIAIFICFIDRVNISIAMIPMVADYGWDEETQGRIYSSFFIGYALLQIVGGRLADKYGGKIVLLIGVIIWSLFTIFTPPAAALGLTALIMMRILMGMGEAVAFPSFYSLYGRWIPLVERSRAVAVANSGIAAGTIFALLVTPIIVIHLGWEWSFYLFGAAGFIWCAAWQYMVTSQPKDHPKMTPQELAIINEGTGGSGELGKLPWGKVMSNSSVWAIIVAHFCNNWTLFLILSWLPTFLSGAYGIDIADVGFLAILPHIGTFVFLNIAGITADHLIKNGMAVIKVRKLMMTIGFGGITISMMSVGYAPDAYSAIAIMSVGAALGAFVTGGFSVNHMDIAPRHAGSLLGITNTAGTFAGAITSYFAGWLLSETGSWTLVFQIAGGVTAFGLIFYLIFASSEKQFD